MIGGLVTFSLADELAADMWLMALILGINLVVGPAMVLFLTQRMVAKRWKKVEEDIQAGQKGILKGSVDERGFARREGNMMPRFVVAGHEFYQERNLYKWLSLGDQVQLEVLPTSQVVIGATKLNTGESWPSF